MSRATMLRTIAVMGVAGLALAGCTSSETGAAGASPTASAAEGDGRLVVGTNLPQTGSLASLGPSAFAGVDLAAEEINGAGGVLGRDIEVLVGDSGDTSSNIASQTADRQLSQGADVIIGAASRAVTLAIIDRITGAGVLQISPVNTSPELTIYPDNGLFARTAPPDTFQGRVLGDLVASDGHMSAAILAVDDAYGTGLADDVEGAFSAAGGTVVSMQIYDRKSASFAAEVREAKASNPEAIVLIGFEESGKIVEEMVERDVGPQDIPLYLVGGNVSDSLYEDLPVGVMEGTKGTRAGAEATEGFRDRLLEVDPDLSDFSYAPEAYDAVIIAALAAEAAGDDSGEAMAQNLGAVTSGGQKCTSYQECLGLLTDGRDIDYDGQSGPIEIDENGDPGRAVMGIYEYGADNTYSRTESEEGEVPSVAGE